MGCEGGGGGGAAHILLVQQDQRRGLQTHTHTLCCLQQSVAVAEVHLLSPRRTLLQLNTRVHTSYSNRDARDALHAVQRNSTIHAATVYIEKPQALSYHFRDRAFPYPPSEISKLGAGVWVRTCTTGAIQSHFKDFLHWGNMLQPTTRELFQSGESADHARRGGK
jgi:hypothetical protein